MTTFTDVFGSQTVPPADEKYASYTITANNSLVWPFNYNGTNLLAADIIDLSSSSPFTINLPPADLVSVGQDLLIKNIGSATITIQDASSGAVTTITAGVSKFFYVTNNSTPAGVWSVFTYGTGTSGADAISLAGNGLQASSNLLRTYTDYTSINSNYTILTSDRAKILDIVSGSITLTLPSAAGAAEGFYVLLRNSSSGSVIIDPSGSEIVDGLLTKTLSPNESLFLISSGTFWVTVGYGRESTFVFNEVIVDSSLTNVTLTSSDVAGRMIRVSGVASANVTITLPSIDNVYFVNIEAGIGSFNVTFRTAGVGSTVSMSASQSSALYSDGLNIYTAINTAFISTLGLDDGLPIAPSLFFISDPGTGLYRIGAGNIGVALSGSLSQSFTIEGFKNHTTGSTLLPIGTSAQRPTTEIGKARFNSDISQFEGCDDGTTFQILGDFKFTQTGTGAVGRRVSNKLKDIVSVKDFNASGDNVTDDTTKIQAAIDSLIGVGGIVYFPKGIYRTSAPILLYTDIWLMGAGWTSTYIKPLNGASFTTSQAVIMTSGFVQDIDRWDYYPTFTGTLDFSLGGGTGATAVGYVIGGVIIRIAVLTGGSGYAGPFAVTITGGGGTGATATATVTAGAVTSISVTAGGSGYTVGPYPTMIQMAVGVMNLTIDGNRANVANANGLMIYGGKWILHTLGVINTSGHGIWTEAGTPGSSTAGDDLHDFINMHEATGQTIFLSNNNKHGWWYRGPNDSRIDNVQIKISGWAGFFQDTGATISVGGLKIGTLHAYSCACGHAEADQIHLTSAFADRIYTDSSVKNGIRLTGSVTQINEILGLSNNSGGAAYYTLQVDVANCQVGTFRDTARALTSGTAGGALNVTATGFTISNVTLIGAGTIAATAITITADNCAILGGRVNTYNAVGSKGLLLNASGCFINLAFNTCTLGFDYSNSGKGRNRLSFSFVSNTTDQQWAAILNAADQYVWVSSLGTSNLPNERSQTPVFAASFTPVLASGSYIQVDPLTDNITINAPTVPLAGVRAGDSIEFSFIQDGTGGRTITWNAAFATNYSNTGNVANTRYTIVFRWTGSVWKQVGAGSGWY